MKKSIFVAGFAFMVLAAAAQNNREEPPKPPPPPKPPVSHLSDVPPPPVPPHPPLPPQEELPDDYEAFLKRNPSVKSLGWNAKNEAIVHLKSGEEERYNLKDEKSRRAIEAKYGELPVAPPPPPLPPAPPAPPKPPKKKAITT